MNNWGANHGAISYGHIGADLITFAFQKYGRWEIFQEIAERTYVTIPKPNERLSPSVYCFSRKTGKFSIIGGKKKGYEIWEE